MMNPIFWTTLWARILIVTSQGIAPAPPPLLLKFLSSPTYPMAAERHAIGRKRTGVQMKVTRMTVMLRKWGVLWIHCICEGISVLDNQI